MCKTIDVDRCARCFTQSPFFDQMAVGRIGAATGAAGWLAQLGRAAKVLLPATALRTAASVVSNTAGPRVTAGDIERRLDAARKVFEQVDLFVSPSPSLAREYEQLGIDGTKLVVSDYGFPQLEAPKSRLRTGPVRLGYVGSLVWHKGVHVLLEAVSGLPSQGWTLEIYGNPDVAPDYVDQLRQLASDLPVRFHGRFGREQTAATYSDLDVLVVPSLWLENSPLVIHEAFMARVPVVGARIGGIADLIRDGVNGILYDPASVDDLRAKLRQLVDDRAQIETFAAQSPSVKSIEDDAAWWEETYQRCSR